MACIFNCLGFQLVPQSLITFPASLQVPAFFLTGDTNTDKHEFVELLNFSPSRKAFQEKFCMMTFGKEVESPWSRQSGITNDDENFSTKWCWRKSERLTVCVLSLSTLPRNTKNIFSRQGKVFWTGRVSVGRAKKLSVCEESFSNPFNFWRKSLGRKIKKSL